MRRLPRPSADTVVLIVILLIAAANGLLWLYSVPFHKAPDEGAHFQVVRFIRDHGRLPVFTPQDLWLIGTPTGFIETYAAFPPLAYILSALASLALQEHSMWAARYVSLASYLGTVALTFWIGRRIFPSAQPIAVTAALIVAFLPQFVFTGGYVNNDELAVLETACLMALLVSAWRTGARLPTLFASGIFVGALLITKYTFYGVAGIGFITAAALATYQRRLLWQALCSLVAGTTLMSAWWFIRNIALYGELIPSHVISNAKAAAGGNSLFIPANHGITLLTLSTMTNFWELTLKSFVGAFGFMAIFLDAPYYWAAVAIGMLGLIGVALRVRRGGIDRARWTIGLIAIAITTITLLSTMVVNVYGEYSPQGRYLFPALIPTALAVAAGLHWLAEAAHPKRMAIPARLAMPAATLTLVAINVCSLLFFVIPRIYGQAEHVTVQVDRPAGPLTSRDPIEIAGWSMVEGATDWRPYTPEIVSDYRVPTPGVNIYMGGPPGVGRFIAAARYGFRRHDVADFYGGETALEQVGFWFQLPPDSLQPGKYKLYACAESEDASTPTCNEHDIEVL